jgi:hypothetical protein
MFDGDSWLASGHSWSKEANPGCLLPLGHPGWLTKLSANLLSGWLSSKNIGFAEFLAGPFGVAP